MTPFRLDAGVLEVGVASDDELGLFEGRVEPGEPKAALTEWMLLASRWPAIGRVQVVAIGVSSVSARWWLTSPMMRFDTGRRRILTRSGSLYDLGARGIHDADLGLPERVRRGLQAWGHVG